MKLYATITSERATKGQGGNNEIKIDLMVGSRKNSRTIGKLWFFRNRLNGSDDKLNHYCLYWTDENGNQKLLQEDLIEKGKKQKGE